MEADINNSKVEFFSQGFEIIKSDNLKLLEELRSNIFKCMSDIFSINPNFSPEEGFNYFHKHIESISPTEVNSLRIDLIKKISNEIDFSEIIYRSFESSINALLGPDILAQKVCNIVIQPPLDPNPSELHRDAPLNSPYEIVVWVPFVDCYATKTMYILGAKETDEALSFLEKNQDDWDSFETFCKDKSIQPSVPFGYALVFFTGLFHGSFINQEKETRVSVNIRYKNLFSPSGLKNQLQFFKLLRSSPLAKLGSKLEMKELTK